MQQSYRFTVSGRVQGVGYRAATQRRAQALGLSGWVMNRADGAVEGEAAGPPEALAALRDWLAQGPPRAGVTAVVWDAITADAALPQPFAVRR